MIEIAHAAGVSVEAELGTIGSTDPADFEGGTAQIIYTDPKDGGNICADNRGG
ncbi:class II fructose-bisphosphate aldolase [Suipraeoptans intestinalis]|uniref:class II fructose-bisphosphate aldolase n=1 Tax=Suipraeoptans intestinalis TaxID=2606628 RepID=UPI002FE6DA8C